MRKARGRDITAGYHRRGNSKEAGPEIDKREQLERANRDRDEGRSHGLIVATRHRLPQGRTFGNKFFGGARVYTAALVLF